MEPAVFLYSLFGPFLVWAFEYFLPYPFVIEELFKFFVVLIGGGRKVKTFVFAGIIFALTETVLYTINVYTTASLGYMLTRFISSSILHATTFVTIFLFVRKDRRIGAIGLILSMLLHYLYNMYIPSYIG